MGIKLYGRLLFPDIFAISEQILPLKKTLLTTARKTIWKKMVALKDLFITGEKFKMFLTKLLFLRLGFENACWNLHQLDWFKTNVDLPTPREKCEVPQILNSSQQYITTRIPARWLEYKRSHTKFRATELIWNWASLYTQYMNKIQTKLLFQYPTNGSDGF